MSVNKKRLFINKPSFDDFGLYTYSDTIGGTDYSDSLSTPIRQDKFIGKDLYTTSVGDPINEAIMDSKIINSREPNVDDLKFIGDTSIRINDIVIKNRGVRTRINDVYFRFFMWSHAYYQPKNSIGNWLGYNSIVGSIQGSKSAGWFYNQNGPNFDEDGEPGSFPGLQGLRIVENFDSLNHSTEIAEIPEIWYGYRDNFNPIQAFQKIGTDIGVTNIFQENGVYNPIYFAVHMDGDMNPKNGPDRSRNQTLSIYQFDPLELFNSDGTGKVTELSWDNPDYQTHSTGKKAPAWTAKELKITINTEGGVKLLADGGTYVPPTDYEEFVQDILPPMMTAAKVKLIGDMDYMDDLILNSFPSRQVLTNNGLIDDFEYDYYIGRFANWLPISKPLVSNGIDTQAYHRDENNRYEASAPNVVKLNFDIAVHPLPYDTFCSRRNCLTQYSAEFINSTWNYEDSFEVQNRATVNEYQFYRYQNSGNTFQYNLSENTTNESDVQYIHLVVNWDDVDNQYDTIEKVLVDWPRTVTDLLNYQQQNLYIPKTTNTQLTNNYATAGIKTIKSIIISVSDDEPLRWKLVTTRIFLDIPISQFPDFSEIGGDDYVTIPWPITTPVIGGISDDSKYVKSINDTLGGGKISNTDVIDERFLVDAEENEELGQNIEKMDLEQIRFFNKSYDMNKLLKIPTTNTTLDLTLVTNENLSQKPFPRYFEEFDSNQSGVIDQDDVEYWNSIGRPDIALWIDINLKCVDIPNVSDMDWWRDNWDTTECPHVLHYTGTQTNIGDDGMSIPRALPLEIHNSTFFPVYIRDYNYHNEFVNDDGVPQGFDGDGNRLTFHTLFQKNDGSSPPYDKCNVYQDFTYCKPVWPPPMAAPDGEDGVFGGGTIGDFFGGGIQEGQTGELWFQGGGYPGGSGTGQTPNNPPDVPDWIYDIEDIEQWVEYFESTSGYNWSNTYYNALQSKIDAGHTAEQILEWANITFFEEFIPPASSNQSVITDGCNLPLNHFYVNTDGNVLYNINTPMAGFQFRLEDWTPYPLPDEEVISVGGGDAAANGFQISFNQHTDINNGAGPRDTDFIGFSLTGGVIPSGCGTLFNIVAEPPIPETYDGVGNIVNQHPSPRISQIVASTTNATQFPVNNYYLIHGCTDTNALNFNPGADFNDGTCMYPELIPNEDFALLSEQVEVNDILTNPYYDISGSVTQTNGYWTGNDWNAEQPLRTFSEETSVGQIFIVDSKDENGNLDLNLIENCIFELNNGKTTGKSIDDSSGNLNKGLLIGDYKIKKVAKNQPIRRDSFIKVAKKNDNSDGAL